MLSLGQCTSFITQNNCKERSMALFRVKQKGTQMKITKVSKAEKNNSVGKCSSVSFQTVMVTSSKFVFQLNPK